MALGTYSELQSSVASFLHRDDLTTELKDFIRLAEADLQVRARLSQWQTSATVSMTAGVGSLPSDYVKATSVTYGAENYTLMFVPQIQFDGAASAGESGSPIWYTVRGASLLAYPTFTGSVTLAYTAQFTPLSDSATSNSLLSLFPDVYLEGALTQACIWTRDTEGLATHGALFEAGVGRVRKYVRDYSYPDGLQMRAG